MADGKLSELYYSPRGYWKGLSAIKKLASAAKVTEQQAKDWLKRQAIWQIYLPAPRRVPRPKFDVAVPNEVHQADLLFLPHDRVGRKTIALMVVDVASRYNEAEPLTTEVADALSWIYRRGPLKWPKLHKVDPGRKFMGAASKLIAKHGVEVRRGRVDIHRDQGVVGRWNRNSAARLFGQQYAQEMRLLSGQRSTKWVAWLPGVVAALNGEATRLTGKKPSDAIKLRRSTQKPSSVVPGRLVGLKEPKIPSGVGVRFLYQPGELEGGRRRATDPAWSLGVYRLGRSVTKPGEPALYYLQDGPQRGLVREELVVPPDTQLPPDGVLKRRVVHRCTHPSQPRQPEGRLCARRPACQLRFRLLSAWSQRVRARHSGAARRCDGGRTAELPCHGGRFAFRRAPLYTAHV